MTATTAPSRPTGPTSTVDDIHDHTSLAGNAHFFNMASGFTGVHHCGVCFLIAEDHQADCWVGVDPAAKPGSVEARPHDHLLPLCCPGCLCGSFEEAHPEASRGDQR